MGGSGGGQGSGKVRYAGYLEEDHEMWLDGHGGNKSQWWEAWGDTSLGGDEVAPPWPYEHALNGIIVAALGNSPYTEAYTYDPLPDLDAASKRFALYDKAVKEFNDRISYLDAVQDATSAADDLNVLSETQISDASSAFQTRMTERVSEMKTRFRGEMAAIGAVMSSTYTLGLARMDTQLTRAVADFDVTMAVEFRRQRTSFILSSISAILGQGQLKLEANRLAAMNHADLLRVKITAIQEYLARDLDLNVKDHLWDFIPFQHAGNFVGSISGSAVVNDASRQGLSTWQTALGGGLTGAAAGAMAGAAISPATAATAGAAAGAGGGPIGAVIGGLLGLAGGIL